jgi:molybdate transport system substrate-binding protein
MHKRLIVWFAWMMAAFVTVIGCASTPSLDTPSQNNSAAVELTISAAATLRDALTTLQPIYEFAHAGTTLTFNFGSSGSLQQQIEQGAPVDVFLSASPKQMDALAEQGLLLSDTRKDLLTNSVVLIAPLDKMGVTRFEDLKQDTVARLSIGDPGSTPVGQYSQEVLESLGLADAVQSKLVLAKDVWQILSYVETGNVDAGMLYSTDAKTSNQVQVIATAPPNSHSPIIYPGAVIADSTNPAAADAFVEFLTTDEAIAHFKSYGFLPIS